MQMFLLQNSEEINIRRHFFEVKVNAINAPSYCGTQVSSHFEHKKQRKYEERIREIEMSSFVPLVAAVF